MPPFATTADQKFTEAMPRDDERLFYFARQTSDTTPAITSMQPLHFLTWNPTRSQSVDQVQEYGVIGNVDSTDPEFGDVEVPPASETHRLCLNEEFFRLVTLLGVPTTTEPSTGVFEHTFTSGKAVLPTATIRDTDSQTTRQTWGLAASSYALNVSRAGGVQDVSMAFQPRDMDIDPAVALAPADIRAEVARIFVPRQGFSVEVNDVNVGKLLETNLTYTTDLQTEKYVGGADGHDAIFVGDPSLTVGFAVRFRTEAQRAALGGPDTPMKVAITGTGPNGSEIRFEMDRVFGDAVYPAKDGVLQRLTFSGQAARSTTNADKAMMRVVLRNTINPDD